MTLVGFPVLRTFPLLPKLFWFVEGKVHWGGGEREDEVCWSRGSMIESLDHVDEVGIMRRNS